MTSAVIILAVVAGGLVIAAWHRSPQTALAGCRAGWEMLRSQLPLLALAFLLAGYLETLIPAQFIQRWLGAGSGLVGIMLGSLAGGLLPFGPYVIFPMMAAMRAAGVGSGVLVSFTVGWMLWSSGKLAFELSTLGPGFAWRRMALGLIFPPLTGVLALLLLP